MVAAVEERQKEEMRRNEADFEEMKTRLQAELEEARLASKTDTEVFQQQLSEAKRTCDLLTTDLKLATQSAQDSKYLAESLQKELDEVRSQLAKQIKAILDMQ